MEHPSAVHRQALIAAALALVLGSGTPLIAAEPPPWADLEAAEELALTAGVERLIVPQRYRTVELDWPGLDSILQRAPMELSPAAQGLETVLSLPLPDGTFGRFRVEQSPILEPALAARLPGVETYRGFGLDDSTAFVRFDTTPAGFHAMIRSAAGTVFIDPYGRGETDVYIVYDTRDFVVPESERPVCRVGHEEREGGALLSPAPAPTRRSEPVPAVTSNGATFKQVELAVAATGEYTTFHSLPDPPNVPDAQAAIATTINRVNVVYERDLAIRMVLVDNSAFVYTNPGTDPYSNSCTPAELDINQAVLDTVLGAAKYDLGHVMEMPGKSGGIAGVGPCLRFADPAENSHAKGCTGSTNPVGDPFDIDFVAHEIGHQWGAPHTFNGAVGSCFGNRFSAAAYEPGSGSTIMAYAGICGSDDLQANSDDYFHGASLETIAGYDPTVFGAAQCIEMEDSGNTPPTANAGVNRNIPKGTPFTLCGSGTDPDAGDSLTYLWEELDLGPDPGGPPNDASRPPFFRSFDPTGVGCRTFPKLADILSNTPTIGEILPNVAWPMKFRLTVFDNHPGGTGGGFGQDEVNVTVSGTSGPFRVTSPNTWVGWLGGTTETVTWDVASTSSPPVDCPNVDIRLSVTGGHTFRYAILPTSTPNDGAQSIVVPNVTSGTVRIRVSCSDNVFFDINDADSSVIGVTCPDQLVLADRTLTQSWIVEFWAGTKMTLGENLAARNIWVKAPTVAILNNSQFGGGFEASNETPPACL